MTYPETITSLAESLAEHFPEVYHSVEIIVNDQGIRMPAYPDGAEYHHLIDFDNRETVYIRRAGDDEMVEEARLSSCSKAYRMRTPLRIVYAHDHAQATGEPLFRMMQKVLIQGIRVRSIVRDKFKLAKDESSAQFALGGDSLYFAVDVYAFWDLTTDNCAQDFCTTIENPIKNCS